MSLAPQVRTATSLARGPLVLLVGFDRSSAGALAEEFGEHGVAAFTSPPGFTVATVAERWDTAAIVWAAGPTDAEVVRTAEALQGHVSTRSLPIVVTGCSPGSVRSASDVVASTIRAVSATSKDETNVAALSTAEFDDVVAGYLKDFSQKSGAIAIIDGGATVSGANPRARLLLTEALIRAARENSSSLEVVGVDGDGVIRLLFRERDDGWVVRRLREVVGRVVIEWSMLPEFSVPPTPIIGWTMLETGDTPTAVAERVAAARSHAAVRLDLEPVRWPLPGEGRGRGAGLARYLRHLTISAAWFILLSWLVGIVAPLALLILASHFGVDLSMPLHVFVAGGLLFTSLSMWAEGFASMRPPSLPPNPAGPPAPATAIIAAYLPNEALTILDTLQVFLEIDYPELQIIVAYNRVDPLPVERDLEMLASRNSRLTLLHVPRSTSKAQNVNFALSHSTGEIVGIFDADHHPERDAFRRANRWLAAGYDVVQGHCVVRNGYRSMVSRSVAVEFECIYAVSHPGRARLHGFGIFGGSNGYWRRRSLDRTRLHDSMLTEDIDSSIRLVSSGGRIASDPGLISRELAPTNWQDLWRQRVRWAQGWFQVSRRHFADAWDSSELTRRQRIGMALLIGWRDITPWLSQLIIPVLVFQAWQLGWRLDGAFARDAFLLTGIVTFTSAPGQLFFAWRNAQPEVRRVSWFLSYFGISMLFYTEWKNLISRVAQLRELFGRNEWIITPRH